MLAYKTIYSIKGPLLFVNNTENIGYQELVNIVDSAGNQISGQVIALNNDIALIQLYLIFCLVKS